MTGPSLVLVVSALALVLALVTFLAHALRRMSGVRGGRSGFGAIEVVSRAGLGPRQGVATVRVAGRMLLVSYGEGGVRSLGDLGEAPAEEDAERGARASEAATDAGAQLGALLATRLAAVRADRRDGGRPAAVPALWAAARRKIAGLRAPLVMLALAFGGAAAGAPASVSAQEAAAPPAGVAETAPSGAAAPTRSADAAQVPGARMSLSIGGEEADEGLQLSGPVGTVVLIGFMTLIPTLLLLMTSFTRILIVLHLLKQALGTQTAPPAHLLAAMALLLTGFVMAPTFERIQVSAVEPWMNGETDEVEMLRTASGPMREFMLRNTREQDLASFTEMRQAPPPETIDDVPLVVVASAFVTSELTSAFQMGFALFLPFVVIDIVVASVLMSMGMFMLPPVMVSLPFKLLLFVLVDGWSLIMSSLVRSF